VMDSVAADCFKLSSLVFKLRWKAYGGLLHFPNRFPMVVAASGIASKSSQYARRYANALSEI